VFCYLADKTSGKAGLDSRWPFAETVQFMYSRFGTQRPSNTHGLDSVAFPHQLQYISCYATCSTLPDPVAFRYRQSFFPPVKAAKIRPCPSAPTSSATPTRRRSTSERSCTHNPIDSQG